MEILFLTSGNHVPSTRFRVLQYIPGLEAAGHRCIVAHSVPEKYRGWPLLGNRLSEVPRFAFRLRDWLRAWRSNPDVIVVERELSSSGFSLPERMFRKVARRMVLDVDDAIFLKHPEKFRAIASMCDLVVAGNCLLRERIELLNTRVVVVPTCVDTARYALKPDSAASGAWPVLGWTGTASNFNSLRVIAGALRALARTRDFELLIVAEREPAAKELGLDGVRMRYLPWQAETEIRDLHNFDVGLMPLEDSEWTRYKCGLKILQYLAAGIPAVASPVGVNREIIDDGVNGFLASSESEWVTSLGRLMDDADLRHRMGAAGRATVEQRYSVAVNLPKFEAALVEAMRGPRSQC
jgi:glycosyltransferase involved in cell wall biosynthesis